MGVVTDLGMSDQEVQDALNLEKLYSVLKKSRSSCTKCGRYPTHLDCSSYKFLCSAHAVGRPMSCKQIGVDRFDSFEMQKLQKKYSTGSNSSKQRSKSSHSRNSRHNRSSSKSPRSRKKRSPSVSSDDSFKSQSDSGDEYELPVSRPERSSSRRLSSHHSKSHSSSQPTFAASFSDTGPIADSPSISHSFDQQHRFPPGMAGILMQKQSYQSNGNPQDSFMHSNQSMPQNMGRMNPNYNQYNMGHDSMRMMSGYESQPGYNQAQYNSSGRAAMPGQVEQASFFPDEYTSQDMFARNQYESNQSNLNLSNSMFNKSPASMYPNHSFNSNVSPENIPYGYPQPSYNSYQAAGAPPQQAPGSFGQANLRGAFLSNHMSQLGAKSSPLYPQMFQSNRVTTNPFDNPGQMQQRGHQFRSQRDPFEPNHSMNSSSNFGSSSIRDMPSAFHKPLNQTPLPSYDAMDGSSWFHNPAMTSNLQRFNSVPSNVSPRIPNVMPGQKDWWD